MPELTRDQALGHLLGELEAAIMRVMWARETATVRDVFEALRAGGRSSAYTTVMTVMARLVDKDLLARELAGKTHIYRAITTQEGFVRHEAAKQVQVLVEEFGDIAIAQFLAKVTGLSPQRRRQLQRLARDEAP